MARFQIRKDEMGFITIPKAIYKSKGWVKGTYLAILQGVDGSLIIRDIPEPRK